jgi:asparagine synthase (glutamine-hydrolysing)
MFKNEKAWKKHISSLKKVKQPSNKTKLKDSIIEAIKNSIPNKKFGILFSGGIDSTFIALVCKQLKKDFICYSVGLENSEDLIEAKKVAKALKLKLKTRVFSLDETETVLKKVTKILKDPDVMKVGVASVVYAAIELAKKDKIKHFFTGLGSEEIFAGYQRHELSKDINKECWIGLRDMYKRDIDRDLKIANKFKSKLLVPLLDDNVIINAMNIKANRKLNKKQNKIILREIAQDLGLSCFVFCLVFYLL